MLMKRDRRAETASKKRFEVGRDRWARRIHVRNFGPICGAPGGRALPFWLGLLFSAVTCFAAEEYGESVRKNYNPAPAPLPLEGLPRPEAPSRPGFPRSWRLSALTAALAFGRSAPAVAP